MKNRFLNAAATLSFLTAVILWAPYASAKDPAPAQQAVVTVNGKALTQADIDADIQQKMAGAAGKMPPEQLEQIKTKMQEKAVDNFITKTVLDEECTKEKITATPKEVDAALDEMRKSLPEKMTLEEALKEGGMSMDSIKKDITFGLKANKLIDAKVKDVPVPTEADVKQFYEQNAKSFEIPETVEVRHILIKFAKDDDEKIKAEKRARIEKIRTELLGGADFAKMATENSDCPSKVKGGSLGSFERGRMVKEFDDAAFSQKENEIGPVIETRFGYHIIQVQSRKPAGKRSFDEVKDQIKTHLEQKNKNTAVRTYIEGLKSKATIVYGKK